MHITSVCTYVHIVIELCYTYVLIEYVDMYVPAFTDRVYLYILLVCIYYTYVHTVWTENFVGQNFSKLLNFATRSFTFLTPIVLIDCKMITSLGVHE